MADEFDLTRDDALDDMLGPEVIQLDQVEVTALHFGKRRGQCGTVDDPGVVLEDQRIGLAAQDDLLPDGPVTGVAGKLGRRHRTLAQKRVAERRVEFPQGGIVSAHALEERPRKSDGFQLLGNRAATWSAGRFDRQDIGSHGQSSRFGSDRPQAIRSNGFV